MEAAAPNSSGPDQGTAMSRDRYPVKTSVSPRPRRAAGATRAMARFRQEESNWRRIVHGDLPVLLVLVICRPPGSDRAGPCYKRVCQFRFVLPIVNPDRLRSFIRISDCAANLLMNSVRL